jgi:hypothetical protein
MKKETFLLWTVLWLTVSLFGVPTTLAQFPKKLSDIIKTKPKAPPPKQAPPAVESNTRPTQSTAAQSESMTAQPERPAARPQSGAVRLTRPHPTDIPVFLLNSLEIKCLTRETYWKFPNQNDYSSWIPNVAFDVFYDDSARLRYVAEFFHPDGSPWFSETLRQGLLSNDKTVAFQSDNSNELLNTKAVTTTGTYGVKIANSKTNEVIFQGKFKVGKFKSKSNEPRYKNDFDFYVEHDWLLPIGYLGFESGTSWESPMPTIYLWFKGDVEEKELEARLFYNGQEIATTDTPEQSDINEGGERFSSSKSSPDLHQWRLWEFTWFNFRVANGSRYIRGKPNMKFTEDMPGEYTVKVFRKGVQVREAKFRVGLDGLFVDSGLAGQINIINYTVILPVKVMGTQDKWNAAAWKTDAFYGNPLSGFSVP